MRNGTGRVKSIRSVFGRRGESFSVRPIVLGSSMQIHDGRHRLFAAFEFLGEHGSERNFEVNWDRVP
jgi:hypothetical protein